MTPHSVILEGAYARLLIYLFWYLFDTGMQNRMVFLWLYGVLAALVFAWICVRALMIRNEYPWRWVKSLTYCVLILLALRVSNTDVMRLLVFLSIFGYALTLERLGRKKGKPEARKPSGL